MATAHAMVAKPVVETLELFLLVDCKVDGQGLLGSLWVIGYH